MREYRAIILYLFLVLISVTLSGVPARAAARTEAFRPSIEQQFSFLQAIPLVGAALDGLVRLYDPTETAMPAALPFETASGAGRFAGRAGSGRPVRPVSMDTATAGVFGSVAIPFKHLKALGRWKTVLARVEKADFADCFGLSRCGPADRRIVRAIAAARSAPDLPGALQIINTSVNRAIGYESDRKLYDTTDYWADPAESIANGKGDCEDFAILKMAALHAAGLPVDSMSLVVLRDRRHRFFHAVLAVATTGGDYVLDILGDRVREASAYPDYQPLYSLSGDRAWIHGYARSSGRYAANTAGALDAAPGTGPADAFFGSRTGGTGGGRSLFAAGKGDGTGVAMASLGGDARATRPRRSR